MTPQERDLIQSLLGRLQQQANQPKDREAEALIARGMAAIPDAPYLLVQTVLIQDMALAEAHNRIKELEQRASAPPPAQEPASFLGGARGSVPSAGPWARPQQPSPAAPAPVWTQSGAAQPQPPQQPQPYAAPPAMGPLASPGASSGFLRQAATTAAGIAGGALLFEGIRSMFGPHYGGGFLAGTPMQPGLGETVINNYYDAPAPDATQPDTTQAVWDDSSQDQDPGQDFSSDQDFGSDDGGSGGDDSYDV
ncbi:MAG TPA: DUF2076 domain-containing protein [Stellaceae bacterium]|nr:DUF2076 domain-containing protein [Stellaceae bacterium]